MVKVTFRTHLYEWEGEFFRQIHGRPIGLRATGSLARILMDIWLQEFRKILEDNNVNVLLLKKYVDDVLLICPNLRMGSRWNGTSLIHSKEGEEQDRLENKSPEQVSLDAFIAMGNSVR